MEWNKYRFRSKSIAEFNKLRKDDHNVNSLISSSSKRINYYFYHDRNSFKYC